MPRTSIALAAFLLVGDTLLARHTDDLAPHGLTVRDWAEIKALYEKHRHSAVHVDGEYRARNPRQRWLTHFDGRGFTVKPDAGEWVWGLELLGHGDRAKVRVDGDRVSYRWSDAVEEWFANDLRGLEHGFTIRSRPDNQAGGMLLRFSVRGGLRPLVNADARDVEFGGVLQYSGLAAWDADGQRLPARLSWDQEELRIEVADAGARYPVTVDPIVQQARLEPANPARFGTAVAASGDAVVIGDPRESSAATGINGNQTDNSQLASGAAYVFVRTNAGWVQQAYLKASNSGELDHFGSSVGIDGDTVVVGAYLEASSARSIDGNAADDSAPGSGAAYVFTRANGVWSQQAYLKASNASAGDNFGLSVAVAGNTIVAGAPNSALSAGAAYVFERAGGVWSQQAHWKASNAESQDSFGRAVAITGGTITVGAPGEDSSATGLNGNQADNSSIDSGAVYVFGRSNGSWAQQAYLKASNTDSEDFFGSSVAVDGDTIVVGAPGEDGGATGVNGNQEGRGAPNSGAGYVFVRSAGTWSQQAYLKASNTGIGDEFGTSVTISGDIVVVGAIREASNASGIGGDQTDDTAPMQSGAAYVYRRSNGSWTDPSYLKSPNAKEVAFGFIEAFGVVAAAGDTIAVGAWGEGSAYVFESVPFQNPPGCTFFLGSSSANVPAAGGDGNVRVIASPDCARSVSSNADWLTVMGNGTDSLGTSLLVYRVARNQGGPRWALLNISGQVFVIYQAGAVPGAAPFAGEAPRGPYSMSPSVFQFEDPQGADNLSVVNILISSALDGRNACYLAYTVATATLVLVNNAGEAGGPFAGFDTIPGSRTLSNSQCAVYAGRSEVSMAGNLLTLRLALQFYGGPERVIYTAARDIDGNNSGWRVKGVVDRTLNIEPPQHETRVRFPSPLRSAASNVTLATTFSARNGFADLSVLNLLINSALDGRSACYMAFVVSSNNLLLVNDAGTAGGPFVDSLAIPGSGTIGNSQCSIDAAGSSVVAGGDNLTLSLHLSFSESFGGDRIIYAAARDDSGNNSGWQPVGTMALP
ncbi:MAG: hypothetical protein R2729_02855 [Bryobacteraceae bacterium]